MAELHGISTEIVAVIDSVCAKLQVPVEKLYAVCVKQAVVSGIFNVIASILTGTLFAVCVYFIAKVFRANSKEDYCGMLEFDNAGFPIIAACFLIGSLMLTLTLVGIDSVLTCLINPEYKAIEIISDLFKVKS